MVKNKPPAITEEVEYFDDRPPGEYPPFEGWVKDDNGFFDPTMVDPNDIDPARR